MLSIDIRTPDSVAELDLARLRRAVQAIAADAGIERGAISIALIDDRTIHELNRKYLEHDCPTDVLSFVLESAPGYVEGEIVASVDTAERRAAEFGWRGEDELLLYVIHGTLHLVGHDDQTVEARREMRKSEARYLALFGLTPRHEPESEHTLANDS
jgi:probable rRNA maturation factor